MNRTTLTKNVKEVRKIETKRSMELREGSQSRDHKLHSKRMHINQKLHNTCNQIVMLALCTLDVEKMVFCMVIAPALLMCLVIWLQMVASPLGAILFYSIFIPMVVGAAMVDYARKH